MWGSEIGWESLARPSMGESFRVNSLEDIWGCVENKNVVFPRKQKRKDVPR